LFLSKLREIEIQYGEERTSLRRRDKHEISVLTTTIERPGTELECRQNKFVRVSTDISMERGQDEKRPDTSTSTVVLAFPVDPSGAPDPQPTSQVFAFLPIRQMGFKFSIQAD